MSSSSKNFCSPEDIEKRNLETTDEKDEMQIYEKRILQCVLAEKITPMDLKHWPFFHVLKPEFIPQIHMVMIYGNCGRGAIILMKDKNVYNLSYNENDCSKTSDIHIVSDLKQIEELCGKNIKTFACSSYFILALTEEGEVYFWKIDKPTLNKGRPVKAFIRVPGFNKKHIVNIACGEHHFLVLTSDGEVYAWEDNIYMQDGNKYTAIFNGSVRQIKQGLEEKNVVHIACGKKFNMVITDENKLYGWGSNEHGQISTVRPQKYYKQSRKITTFSDKIVKMVCGFDHTLALTNKGEIYAWGSNNCGQVGVNNNLKFSDPIVVNVPQMGKVLNVDACGLMSVAVGYDRTIYVWGYYFDQEITKPFPTKFSRIFDVFAYSLWKDIMCKLLIVHDSLHTEGISNNNNYKYTEEVLNIFESLEAAFDDPLTSDLTIRVEGRPIYVHKAILKICCQYFENMFQHDWAENIQSISDSVYTVSEKFSYIVYKAFLKYLYTGIIDLPSENALELMELADMYCETNLKKDCSRIIKQTINVSNVAVFYNKAIEYNAKELEEFCFQFALRHMTANTLSLDYIKLDTSRQAKFTHRAATQSRVTTLSSKKFCSPGDEEKRNSETTTNEKDEMQKYEKRILRYILAEKITSAKNNLKSWPFFHLLKSEFIPHIHMVMVYGNSIIIVTKDKNVYSLDQDEISYLNAIDTALCPKRVEELCGKNIKTFAHSDNVILALTEEGEVYFAKKYDWCRDECDVPTFTQITGLSDKCIVDIRYGYCHGLALTSDGKVYAWGQKFQEQICNENADSFNASIRQVKHGLEKKNVVHIASGDKFNIVVTDENTIYGWGYNVSGQISIDRTQIYYEYPREIIRISDKIVKVVCGCTHTLALTNKGEVYAWGDNLLGEVGVNNNRKRSSPTVVNVPEMGKVLDIAANGVLSVAVGCDRIIYVWGHFHLGCSTPIPFPTKFSNIYDAFAHSIHKSLIVFTNNLNNVEEVLNILESLRTVFDDPLTNDFTIRVEGRPIYVHKAILKIRCQYFKNMFQHNWTENIQSISDSVYTVSDKFSYVVYKAFLKYLYTGIIDLSSENVSELMELANIYCETNLIKDCSQLIIKVITVSNVAFFYNKAIECNAKELEELCFQFALRHMKAVVLSEEYIKLDTSTKDNFMRRAAKENAFGISFF